MGCDEYETELSMEDYLQSIGLSSLSNLFVKEKITLDVLAIMTHDDLKAIGIDAFGTRFRLLKNIGKCIPKSKGFHQFLTHLDRIESFFFPILLFLIHLRQDMKFGNNYN